MFMRKITKQYKSVSRLFTPIALALMLAACESTGPQTQIPQETTASARESSSYYLLKAESSTGQTQIDWYLLALEASLNENALNKADQLIRLLAKKPMSPLQLSEWQLDRADLETRRGNYQTAVNQLNFQSSWKLPSKQFLRYYQQKTHLYRQLNQLPNAVMNATLALHFIQDSEMLKEYTLFIWQSLEQFSNTQLEALSRKSNLALNQWITLVKTLRIHSGHPAQQEQVLNQWIANNPEHPAARYRPEKITTNEVNIFTRPNKVAVLLPLTGKFAVQGEAIRNGLLQGFMEDTQNAQKPNLRFFDTHQLSMLNIANQLKNEQIQFVIGPLEKHKISEYLKITQNAYPTLAMNMLNNEPQSEPNTCFFTLSPEQEAQQAANYIQEKNHQFPLIIAPNNSLGKRVTQAFSNQWKGLTGKPAESVFFANTAAMQKTVQQAFGLTESYTRGRNISQLLELDLKTEQRSRRDIDAVYLVANSDELTLLKPFIEVTVNPEVAPPKLFATSRGNNRVRGMGEIGELKGIEFTDIPLIVNKNSPDAATFYQQWPDLSNGTTRLYALGLDAYTLIDGLPNLQSEPGYQIQGHSGQLTMGPFCTIQRTLSWMVFDNEQLTSAH